MADVNKQRKRDSLLSFSDVLATINTDNSGKLVNKCDTLLFIVVRTIIVLFSIKEIVQYVSIVFVDRIIVLACI